MKLIPTIGLCVLLSACASTEYRAYEAKQTVFEGQGGTRTTVEGIDIWENGNPPRKFKVLGIIEDQRPGAIIPMAQLRGDIARKAKEAGGTAVILISSESQLAGFVNTGSATAYSSGNTVTAYGSGVSAPMRRSFSKFAVIQYLD